MTEDEATLAGVAAELAYVLQRLPWLEARIGKLEAAMRYPPLGVFMAMQSGGSDEPETV